MITFPLKLFSPENRRQIGFLIAGHMLWSGAVFGLSMAGRGLSPSAWWSMLFLALQFHAATQLLLPALQLRHEERSRRFYYAWGVLLVGGLWGLNQVSPPEVWQPLLTALKSGALLLAATIVGSTLARYVRRLWEIIPVFLVMTFADFFSWRYGPTGGFSRQIEDYYLAPEGPPPLVDMLLVKLARPGSADIVPVFGLSDWIMVAFFVSVARHHGINDNLGGPSGEALANRRQLGRFLPVPAVALFAAILMAQSTRQFVPALPVMALALLCWYALRCLRRKR